MSKNLKTTYILFFVFAGIILAWNTLTNFFSGVAINYIAICGLAFAILLIMLKDTSVWKRVKDLFIAACVFCVLELIIYFALEFGWCSIGAVKGFLIYQSVITILGIIYTIYLSIRFAFEVVGKKIGFIEAMLGNRQTPKVKKAKEISNGCLEEKPNNKPVEKVEEQTQPQTQNAEENEE